MHSRAQLEALLRPEVKEHARRVEAGLSLTEGSLGVPQFAVLAFVSLVVAVGGCLLTYERAYEVTPIEVATRETCGRLLLIAKIRQAKPAAGRFGYALRPQLEVKSDAGVTAHWRIYSISRERSSQNQSWRSAMGLEDGHGPLLQLAAVYVETQTSSDQSLTFAKSLVIDPAMQRPPAMQIVYEPIAGLLFSSWAQPPVQLEATKCSEGERQ